MDVATNNVAPNGDMDIDMTDEMDIGPGDLSALEADYINTINNQSAEVQYATKYSNGVLAQGAPPEENPVVPEKVHLNGVNDLHTSDIKAFAGEHYSLDNFERVEWINDESANIIYSSAQAAAEALAAFCAEAQEGEKGTGYVAKRLSSKPEIDLYVRETRASDKKAPRAHEASRYYLLNPDKDPRESRRQNQGPRRGRRRPREEFDENMYDDNYQSAPADGRRDSPSDMSDVDDHRRKRVRFDGGRRGGDLFSHKIRGSGRLRDRSASPTVDGRFGFAEDESATRSRIRRRSLTPPAAQRKRPTGPKELFPDRAGRGSVLTNGSSNDQDLFPDRVPSNAKKTAKELFPHKASHRRSDAIDAADQTSPQPFPSGGRKPRDLFDRLDRPLPGSTGRLFKATDTEPDTNMQEDVGFSIKGRGGQEESAGFSIRGAAQGESKKSARELFPNKFSNDLFAEKLQGRGGKRQRAADLFG